MPPNALKTSRPSLQLSLALVALVLGSAGVLATLYTDQVRALLEQAGRTLSLGFAFLAWLLSLALVGLYVQLYPIPALFRLRPQSLARASRQDMEFASLASVRQRESDANVVWVISPRLYYDVVSVDFFQIIEANKQTGTRYCYIVPRTAEIERNIQRYKEKYHHSLNEIDEMFLIVDDSPIRRFMSEVAIYDPGTKDQYAYAIPPSAPNVLEDVLRFNQQMCEEYSKRFDDIWRALKNSAPLT